MFLSCSCALNHRKDVCESKTELGEHNTSANTSYRSSDLLTMTILPVSLCSYVPTIYNV